jgi:hypothetical protein
MFCSGLEENGLEMMDSPSAVYVFYAQPKQSADLFKLFIHPVLNCVTA